jgi:replicative DNA helicase
VAQAPPIDGKLPGRVPPSDLEAEQSVLGAMLLDELAIIKVSEFLRPADFYRKNHEDIYRAALELLSMGEPIDIVTVGAELEKMGVLERIGGRSYLAQLEQAVPTAANIEFYGRIVKEKATKRSLISAGGDIAGLGYDEAIDAPDALNRAQKVVFDISEDRLQTDFEKLFGLLRTTMERVDALQNNVSGTVGVASGFFDLDAKTNGFKNNELIIIAGRPSMGKCVANTTLLDDPLTGERVTVEEWVRQRRPLAWGISNEGRLRAAPVSDWVDSGRKPVFKVTTKTGRAVEVTGHHPFLTISGWQPLHDLSIGDTIGVPRALPSFGSEQPDPGLVRLMAYYIAEGGLTHSTPAFTNVDPELIKDFRGIVSTRFPELQIRQRKITYFATSGRTGGRSNPITTWLRELGLMGKHADDKAFPSAVWRWERRTLAEFLSTLFACDGTIYNMAGFPRIEFTVASKQLAEDVHHALTRFGIIAKLWRKTERSWRVEITEPQSVWRYQLEIGWKGEKGWRFAVPGDEPARRSNTGHIPTAVWGKVKAAAAARAMTLTQVIRASGERGSEVRGYNPHVRRGLPRTRLEAYATVLESPKLKFLASPDIFWDPIVSIEPMGEKQVYDLSVPDGANFVAQDVYLHNTSLALNIALEAAVREKVTVAIFSLEMSKDQLAERLLCEHARVDAQRLHRGLLGEAEHERLAQALGPLGEAPIFIDDSPMLDELMLLTKARRIKLQENVGMVIVDYLQLMHSRRGSADDNRVQEVSQISRSMKALARELKVPVLALSQLSRGPEQRTDKRPMLSDLRESGSIEQDADVVIFLYREGYYNKADTTGIAEVIVAKNRNGPTGTVNLRFRPELTRFENLDMRRRGPDDGGGPSSPDA